MTQIIDLYRKSLSGLSHEVWMLSLVTFINRSGAMVLPFMSVYLTHHLQYSFTQAGIIMSFFGLGSVLGALLGGFLTDKIGFYKVMFWSLFLTAFLFFILSQVQSFTGLCFIVFLTSMVADAFRPASQVAIGTYSNPDNTTRSISLYRLAINLGFSIGPAIGGIVASSIGYKWLFLLDGGTCMTAAFLFLLILPQAKVRKHEIATEKKNTTQSAYRDFSYLIFVIAMILTGTVFMQFFNTVPVFFKEHFKLEEHHIGLILGINGLLIVLTEMPLTYLLESQTKLKIVILGISSLGMAFLSFLLFPNWLPIIFVAVIFLTLGEILFSPFSNSFALERAKSGNRGQYMGLFTLGYSVAHIASPIIGLHIAGNYGFNTLWLLLLALVAFAIAFLWIVQTNIFHKLKAKVA